MEFWGQKVHLWQNDSTKIEGSKTCGPFCIHDLLGIYYHITGLDSSQRQVVKVLTFICLAMEKKIRKYLTNNLFAISL